MKSMSPAPSEVSSADEVAGLLEHRTRRGAELHAHLAGHEHRERGLAQTGRTEEERVVERLAAPPRGVDRDLQRGLDLRLSDELVEPRRAQRRIGARLLGQRFGRRDLESLHVASA